MAMTESVDIMFRKMELFRKFGLVFVDGGKIGDTR